VAVGAVNVEAANPHALAAFKSQINDGPPAVI
jgi:hypothetical protein